MAAKDHLKYMSSNEEGLTDEVKNGESSSDSDNPSPHGPKEENEALRALYEANTQLLLKRNENEQTINQMKKVINDFLSSTEVAERKINQLILEKQDSESKLIVLEDKLHDFETKQDVLTLTAEKESSSTQDLSSHSEKSTLLVDLNNAETRIAELKIDLRNASKRIEMLESKLHIDTQRPYELLKIKNHQSKNQLVRRESLKKLESSEEISYNGDSKPINHSTLDTLYKNFSIDNLGQTEDSELNRLWSELSLARQQITSLEIDKAHAFNEINDLKQIEEHTKSDFEELQQKYERSQRSIRSLEMVLDEKDEGDKKDDEVQILRTEVVELKRRVDELEDEKSMARKEVVDLEFDLKKANDKITSLKNARSALIRKDNLSDIPFQVDIRHFEGPQLLNVKSNLVSNDALHINKTDGTLLGAMWSSLSLNREKISGLEKKNNLAKQMLNVL